jgi:hypothetical protein
VLDEKNKFSLCVWKEKNGRVPQDIGEKKKQALKIPLHVKKRSSIHFCRYSIMQQEMKRTESSVLVFP